MATATVTVSANNYPKGKDFTGSREIANGTFTVQASPATYVTGGLPVSFLGIEAIKNPISMIWCDVKANGTSTYQYVFNETSGTLQIFEPGSANSALVELTGGSAIPAAVSGATINFRAEFSRQLGS